MTKTISILPPERQTTIKLKDGRNLGWYEWGRKDAQPVLFCPGAATSGSLGFGFNDLDSLGLRLLAIDRPGLGTSHHDPNKSLSSWVQDVSELLQSQSLTNVLAVGFSQGAPFALALAHQKLVKAAAIVSGQDQLDHALMMPMLHPDILQMVNAVKQDPNAFENQVIETFGLEQMWHLVMTTSGERDRKIYQSDSFSKAFRHALEQGYAQGTRGYARDLIIALTDWPFQPEDIEVPVDLWYGLLDTSTVHSPDFGATLAKRIPSATRYVLDDEGSSLLWTRAGDILDKLKAHQ